MADFGNYRAIALAAVVALTVTGPLAAAEHEDEGPVAEAAQGLASYEKLLTAALAGEPAARGALLALFNEFRGDTSAIATLAVELIGAIDGDAVAIIDAATMIADVASQILNTRPIVRVSVGDDLKLPPSARGWDFGAADSQGFGGFEKVTAADKGIVTGA